MEVDDNWQLVLDFGGARLASVDATNCVQGTRAPQMEIYGLQGTVAVHSLLDVGAPVEILPAHGTWERVQVEAPRDGLQAGIDLLQGIAHIVSCIQDGKQPVTSVDHALHVVEIIEQAARSAREEQVCDVQSTFQIAGWTV